ncbi:bifunctional tetrahydrofolate synthase/dihydrofolate synthase [Erwinia phyllosphaerae]|uniref:bifunctional tetrahydrofolate synthase/dihydrofolate synthase n=1 Tax=Erwinia phyllosphaerae TaxID=2853256 RepID=UPI001FF03F34|nr:bifunctional tetrahydrofolate synthase/dihydrofolate synthase [Erwinia phyllosphaerae]MBV4365584.1 bifunctional tetrahydrofolate synthase/dihydrofolate synthase [Erwinia phyllosphaerae]
MDNLPQATSPLATWLHYLENLHTQAIELGLARVQRVATRLDLLTPAPVVFTVAGTNGKGTTCRTLETLLMAAGYRVGVYSSPHLLRYTERVRIQGAELPEADHTASFADIEQGRGDTSLTYFEYGTLSALWLFKRAQLDVVILEVGLGGRLDATNIVDADVAVITSIALDHTDWLGPDRESIGREKAGVFRGGKPAIVGEPDMPHTIAEVAATLGAQLHKRDRDWSFSVGEHDWSFTDQLGTLSGLPLPQVPLPNAATALAALRASPLKVDDAVLYGLDKAVLPGRFQTVAQSPRIILDVAHNPHAAAYLAGRLSELPKTGKVHAVVGMLHDKDIIGTLACLKPQVDSWYCAPLEGPRGATAQQLAAHLPTTAQTFSSVAEAFKHALQQAHEQDIVLVCGSFHTVAHVMETMETESGSGK